MFEMKKKDITTNPPPLPPYFLEWFSYAPVFDVSIIIFGGLVHDRPTTATTGLNGWVDGWHGKSTPSKTTLWMVAFIEGITRFHINNNIITYFSTQFLEYISYLLKVFFII